RGQLGGQPVQAPDVLSARAAGFGQTFGAADRHEQRGVGNDLLGGSRQRHPLAEQLAGGETRAHPIATLELGANAHQALAVFGHRNPGRAGRRGGGGREQPEDSEQQRRCPQASHAALSAESSPAWAFSARSAASPSSAIQPARSSPLARARPRWTMIDRPAIQNGSTARKAPANSRSTNSRFSADRICSHQTSEKPNVVCTA